MLTYGIPPEFRGGVHIKPPYAIGSVPSLSGHADAYRWGSLPRVRRHRASKPQGSSERVLPWQITMDQLIFASLSHTHYWYEVGTFTLHLRCLDTSMLTAASNYRITRGTTSSSLPPHHQRTLLVLHQLEVEHSPWKSYKTFSLTHRQIVLGLSSEYHSPVPVCSVNPHTISVPPILDNPSQNTSHLLFSPTAKMSSTCTVAIIATRPSSTKRKTHALAKHW